MAYTGPRYVRPETADEALALLAEGGAAARLLAGGQSLVPLLQSGAVAPALLIDISRLEELTGIELLRGELVIGAMARMRDIEHSGLVRDAVPLLADAIGCVGYPQVRNRGTIGGSLCHGDPAAEIGATVLALDGTVVVRRAGGGKRTISAQELFSGAFATALAPDEMMTEIRAPIGAANTGWSFLEVALQPNSPAQAGVAAVIRLDGSGRIEHARLAFTGVAETPVRIAAVEERLLGGAIDEVALADVDRLVREHLDPPGDPVAPGEYRRHAAAILARRALEQASGRALTRSPRRVPVEEPRTETRRVAFGRPDTDDVGGASDRAHRIRVTVNGRARERDVGDRILLAEFIRDDLGLTGTHTSCETGHCGACTILVDGCAVRSCLIYAVQADGAEVTTVEGLERSPDGDLHPLQRAFVDNAAVQCGFCTPGALMSMRELLSRNAHPTEEEVRQALIGNVCRCGGYDYMVRAVLSLAEG